MVTRHRTPLGLGAANLRYPAASLDSYIDWNPGRLPLDVNGVPVRMRHPYVAGESFVRYLATTMGVVSDRPLSTQRSARTFGAVLAEIYDEMPDNFRFIGFSERRHRRTSELTNEAIEEVIRNMGSEAPPVLRGGLGEAFSKYAASRLSGESPSDVTWLEDPYDYGGRFESWLMREVSAPGSVWLRAEHGLSSDPVVISLPSSSTPVRQVTVSIIGELQPHGRLFLQTGDVQSDPNQPFYGAIIPTDVSANARTPENSSSIEEGSPLMLSRSFTFCVAGENQRALSHSRWPGDGKLRAILVNAAPGSSGSSPVNIDLRVQTSPEACAVGGMTNPQNPGGRLLKPDGSGEPCPDEPSICDPHDASPPGPPRSLPTPMLENNGHNRAVRPTVGNILGEEGIDCDENRRDRERARRAGRARTSSERRVDRICDDLNDDTRRRERRRG